MMRSNEFKIEQTRFARNKVWAINPDWLSLVESISKAFLNKDSDFSDMETQPVSSNFKAEEFGAENMKSHKGVGVIEISGPLVYRSSAITRWFGFVGYDEVRGAISEMAANSKIGTVILRLSSPGGSCLGVTETAGQIRELGRQKKVVAYIDPYAFSAAYWLASAAQQIISTPSGMVGSIGAYVMHVDYSEALKQDGVKVTFVKAGEKKVDGNAYEPLSDRAKADLQRDVNFYYEAFVAEVAQGRTTTFEKVKSDFGQGGTLLAKDALSAGMIDGILTFEELLAAEVGALSRDFQGAQSRAFLEKEKLLLELENA